MPYFFRRDYYRRFCDDGLDTFRLISVISCRELTSGPSIGALSSSSSCGRLCYTANYGRDKRLPGVRTSIARADNDGPLKPRYWICTHLRSDLESTDLFRPTPFDKRGFAIIQYLRYSRDFCLRRHRLVVEILGYLVCRNIAPFVMRMLSLANFFRDV